MAGNFVVGFGVMAPAGTLKDIARSLDVSIALAGQLIAIGAATVGSGAPLLAGWVAGFDRRRLLAIALVWYGVGHLVSAAMPSYAALWPVRALTMLGAAVFTPQAAAAIGAMAPPNERGRAITFIFSAGRSPRCSACRSPHGSAKPMAGRRCSRPSAGWRWLPRPRSA